MNRKRKILIMNMGSTSTKLAIYEEKDEIAKYEEVVDDSKYKTSFVIEQYEDRLKSVERFLKQNNISLENFAMIVTRGPALWGLKSGGYYIDEHVDLIVRYAPRVQHAASIGSCIAYTLSKKYDVPAIFYDSASSDEAWEPLHYTGIPEIRRAVTCHCLNTKMVGRQVAREMGTTYEKSTFIIAHLGGGITVSLHKDGRIIDTCSDDEGSMSPQRAGKIGTKYMVELCFSGKYTKDEVTRKTRGKGGIAAYFETSNMKEIEEMIDNGDEKAKSIYELMAYQLANSIGGLATANYGKIDKIIFTGGLAYSKRFTELVSERVEFIAPVAVVPGEKEMKALAEGAIRILDGKEKAKNYAWLPKDCKDLSELKEKN